jgi:hypothetical protein
MKPGKHRRERKTVGIDGRQVKTSQRRENGGDENQPTAKIWTTVLALPSQDGLKPRKIGYDENCAGDGND